MFDWQRLRVWNEDGVGRIVMNRPEVRNALDYTTAVELERAVQELTGQEARAIVIQGSGGHFCVGADLGYVLEHSSDPRAFEEFVGRVNAVFFAVAKEQVPVIAAIEGYALAGGFEFMQACDISIVAEDAVIGDQHSNFGLIPGGGGTQRLSRLVGRQRAMGLLLSGEWLSGREAAAWGLAYRAVPAADVERTAVDLARRLAERSRIGLCEIKRLVNTGLGLPLDEAIRLEVDAFCRHMLSADAQEGLQAFRQRRKPNFS